MRKCSFEILDRQSLRASEAKLEHRGGGVVHLLIARCVVPVPDQRHPLGQRMGREDQSKKPKVLHALDARLTARRVDHRFGDLVDLARRASVRTVRIPLKDPANGSLEPFLLIAAQLAPSRTESSATVKMCRFG